MNEAPDIRQQLPVHPGVVIGRGFGYGALWGAWLGSAFIVFIQAAGALMVGAPGLFLAVIFLIPFAAALGLIVGAGIGMLVGIVLALFGARARRHRVGPRLIAAAVSAAPGVIALGVAPAAAELLVPITIAAVVSAAALATRLVDGKAPRGHDLSICSNQV